MIIEPNQKRRKIEIIFIRKCKYWNLLYQAVAGT
jgi:hypothetical protein